MRLRVSITATANLITTALTVAFTASANFFSTASALVPGNAMHRYVRAG